MVGVPVSGRTSRGNRQRVIEQARKREARRKRRRRLAAWGGAAAVLAGVGTGIGFAVPGGSGAADSASYAALSTLGPLTAAPAAGAVGPERVPIPAAQALAGTSATTAGQAIDGISCQTTEQTILHVHTHLTTFVNGKPAQGPA